MIGWLKGSLIQNNSRSIILDVNGVGYLISVGDNWSLRKQGKLGEDLEIPIYTHVREDEIRLFGFESFEAKELFISLLTVNGVGPKMAQLVVDQLSVEIIIRAVQSEDFSVFQQISGIGKKIAQKIILDLNGKLELPVDSKYKNSNMEGGDSEIALDGPPKTIYEDAKSALSNLGFSGKEVDTTLRKRIKESSDLNSLIRKCLSDLNQYFS